MIKKVRLQKYMADQGVASRRKSEEMIAEGMVKVNGKVVTEMGVKVDPEVDDVEVDGKRLAEEREKLRYIKLNKPVGYKCSTNPPEGSVSVYGLVKVPERLFTVGRLDKESEGLILLTNDGRLTYKLTHPKFEKEKEYEVTVDKPVSDNALEQLSEGVRIQGRKTKEAGVVRVSSRKFRIILTEGRNRQIRRMCSAVGLRVHRLKRLRVGAIELGSLERGEWKDLSREERNFVDSILESSD